MTAVLRCSLIPDSLSATPAERATPQATSTTESKTTARAADATGQLITNITIRLAGDGDGRRDIGNGVGQTEFQLLDVVLQHFPEVTGAAHLDAPERHPGQTLGQGQTQVGEDPIGGGV